MQRFLRIVLAVAAIGSFSSAAFAWRVNGELERARLENLTSDPACAAASEGRIFWDSDDNLYRVCNGSSYYTLVGRDTTDTLTNKTLTSPAINTPTITSPTVRSSLLLQNTSGSQPTLDISEDPDTGTNKVTVQSTASLAADYTLTLPTTDGDANQVLQTDGSGVLSWAAPLTNPMDSAGDMIYGGAAGAATKLDSGTSGDWLVSGGAGAPSWTSTVTTAKTIGGGANVVQLTVKANASQSANNVQIRNASDETVLAVEAGGQIRNLRGAAAPSFEFYRANTSLTSPSVLADGDNIGDFLWRGYSAAGATYHSAASITGIVDGTPDSGGDTTDMPSAIQFKTTPEGSSTRVIRGGFNAPGGFLIGDFGAGATVTQWVGTTSGTTTCNADCQSGDGGFGNDTDSGACIMAWRTDTYAPLNASGATACADATNVAKMCLCLGAYAG